MPEIKNQIKESIQFILDRTFENDELCYFSLAKDINEIIFQYFKLQEEEKFKIENENLECRLNKNCDNISPFDPDFKLEESETNHEEQWQNFEDYDIVDFSFDGIFRYYTFLSVFRELLKDKNLKINQTYYLLDITDMYPELKDLEYTLFDYYNKLEISNKYYTTNDFNIFVEEFKSKHSVNPKVFALTDDEVDKIFIEETQTEETISVKTLVEVIPDTINVIKEHEDTKIITGIPKAIEVPFE